MTRSHVLAALGAVTDLETRADALEVFTLLLGRVKPGHETHPISPLEMTRLIAALDAVSVALYAAQRVSPSHWEAVS